MADIFISYAREDREAVEKLAGLLEAAGFTCWWDRQLAAGAKYRERTEIELNAARAVLVVWTKHSVGSHWVADEAAAAVEAGKLAPISLDGVSPPLGFRQFQVIDFTGWKGHADQPVQELVSALGAFSQHPEIKAVPPPAASTPSGFLQRIRWPLITGALVLAAAIGFFFLLALPPSTAQPAQRVAFFGFTTADDDPRSARIAADATDQTFAEFTRFHLDAAAKADSLAPYATDRLTRAAAIGAAYALSGEVRIEGEEARFAIRLEDTATRATLWESAETSALARPLYSPAKQAAFTAAANTSCVVGMRVELSHEDLAALQAITSYCVRPFGAPASTDVERALLALRSLAKLEPRSVFFLTSLAGQLIFIGSYLPADLRAERFGEADTLLKEALAIAPGDPHPVAIAEFLQSSRGGSPLEAEQLLATARPGGSTWGEGFLKYRRGLNLLGNGRTQEGVELLKAAEAAQPSFTQVAAFRAYGLASLGKTTDAELLFEQAFANAPGATLVWPMWVRAAVLEGVGDPEAMLAAAPDSEPRAGVECWRSVLAAKRADKPGPLPVSLDDCGPTAFILAAMGRADDALDYFEASPGQRRDTRMLFAPSAGAIRANRRFLPLVKELQLWDYWIATESHPDFCDLPDEKDFDVCVELRAARKK